MTPRRMGASGEKVGIRGSDEKYGEKETRGVGGVGLG